MTLVEKKYFKKKDLYKNHCKVIMQQTQYMYTCTYRQSTQFYNVYHAISNLLTSFYFETYLPMKIARDDRKKTTFILFFYAFISSYIFLKFNFYSINWSHSKTKLESNDIFISNNNSGILISIVYKIYIQPYLLKKFFHPVLGQCSK